MKFQKVPKPSLFNMSKKQDLIWNKIGTLVPMTGGCSVDKIARSAIEKATQRARKLLEDDFASQLEGTTPKSAEEVEDHNSGVSLNRALFAYLKRRSSAASAYFRNLINDERVSGLLNEAISVVRRRYEQHPKGDREAFDRMMEIRSRGFADSQAATLTGVSPQQDRL